jgi:hypothetical protein
MIDDQQNDMASSDSLLLLKKNKTAVYVSYILGYAPLRG